MPKPSFGGSLIKNNNDVTRRTELPASTEDSRIDGHEVKITHPDKILFPGDGITKGELIQYYERIGPWMISQLEGRPLSMQRYPDGIEHEGFFQKAAASYYPSWIETAKVAKVGGTVKHVLCNDVATLVYLANQACVTLHTWLSRADKPTFPDQMIFDLDPSDAEFAGVVSAAGVLKELLDEIDAPAYLKATGSRGLHVVVPLDRSDDFESVRAFARQVAEVVVASDPARYTLEQRKNKRGARVFIDINRNAYAQTAVAPYSVRPRPHAPVAMPLEWAELRGKKFRPDSITIATAFDRLESRKDPWKEFWRKPVSLKKALRAFQELHAQA
jgi:bifunctional non-homologous end joining protein LigD